MKIIMNPPYNKGNKILQQILISFPDADYSILMPASCYFGNNLYKKIRTLERTENLFDAAVQGNLLLCTILKQFEDNNQTQEEFFLQYCNQDLKDIYNWNIIHYRGIQFIRDDHIPLEKLDINLDFVEHGRAAAVNAGNGFGTGGAGYFFNVVKSLEEAKKRNLTLKFFIHFNSPKEKDNFSTWWYYGKKGKSLSSKLITGIGMLSISSCTKYAIPQINWETINENYYWTIGKYDDAVLDEMNLK